MKFNVSPVIGVIFMVAITVILAAIIAAFVIGMSGTITRTEPCKENCSYETIISLTTTPGVIQDQEQNFLSVQGDPAWFNKYNFHKVRLTYKVLDGKKLVTAIQCLDCGEAWA